MLTRILHNSPELCTFIEQLDLQVSAPQLRHLIHVADGLLVTDAPKTLAEIQRQFVSYVDPSNIADTFRIAPWSAEDVRGPLTTLLMRTALQRLQQQGQPLRLLVNLDDSLAIKDPDTHCLQGVDWHYDHAAKRRKRAPCQNALAYLSCNIIAGDWSFTFAIRPYLRARTVRRLNRHRLPQQRLRFVSKYRLARQILAACGQLIPAGVAVYVHFDAWYASGRLLKYVRRQGWHATCRIQPNRKLNGQCIDQRDLAQRHRRYVYVDIPAADGSKTTYLVRNISTGRIHKVPFDVRVLVSRRHYRDHLPVYFISTDLSLAPSQALQWYARRWNCEIDNFYLKQRLGLGDFRLQPYEAIDKFCAVVHLTWAYVQWRFARAMNHHTQNLADVIRQHRDWHARDWLLGACQETLATRSVDSVLQHFLREEP
jgi:hypothetical protein